MSFKDLTIERSYLSYGPDNISNSLIIPLLKQTVLYRRSVGFFSSNVFCSILEGIQGIVENGGFIQLIISPNLSEDDVKAIDSGYKERKKVFEEAIREEFNKTLLTMPDHYFELTKELIKHSILDIKIACTKEAGMYHDKLGIFTDSDGNTVAFSGSANETFSGLSGHNNYEKVRVFKSWIPEQNEYLQDEIDEFESLWNYKNAYIDTIDFTSFLRTRVFEIIKNNERNEIKKSFSLRPYQKDAVDSWVANGHKGFFVMATGTGKTLTAIYCAKKVKDEKDSTLTVVVAPYKHLLKQWQYDIEDHLQPNKIVSVSSENPSWPSEITKARLTQKVLKNQHVCVIVTNKSFMSERFMKEICKFDCEKILVVDEAHRFMNCLNEELKEIYPYMIGLSATPVSGRTPEKRETLTNFFGGVVANLPLEKALKEGTLVSYRYNPIFIYTTEEDEKEFKKYSRAMVSCFKGDKLIDPDRFNACKRGQLRVIAQSENKNIQLDNILNEVKADDHFIVYCGDGIVTGFGDNEKHLEFVKNKFDKKGIRMSKFTYEEPMDLRMSLVESFNSGSIKGLVAIRCLDEGINIPSIKTALVIASGDNLREFVQRRGRILRHFEGKDIADIYDVILLPSGDCTKIAEIELRRFYEYARLAVKDNREKNLETLKKLIAKYDIDQEMIYDYFDKVEDEGDEYDE